MCSFINRFADLINTRFTAEKMLQMMEGLQRDILFVEPLFLLPADQGHIRIHDALGRKLDTMFPDHFKAGRLDWDAGSLASGLYVVIMKTGGTRYTQKNTILKQAHYRLNKPGN